LTCAFFCALKNKKNVLSFKKRGFIMRKRSIIIFVLLLFFWIVISAEVDLQHVLVGTIVSFATVWLWQDLGPRQPSVPTAGVFLLLARCIVMLAWYIIQSNIAVARTLLFNKPPAKPMFVIMETSIMSNWGRVLLATCITITPGTVTIDVDPETGRFIVHALTEENAVGLLYWRIIDEIERLEKRMKRRGAHVVDTGRAHDFNSPNTLKSDYRTDSH
jgi:multicomponent Na+:H+ antiporter subunit E